MGAPVHLARDRLSHGEYTVGWAADHHTDAVLDLHESVFGTWGEVARAQYDWKYVENPVVDRTPVVVVEDDAGDVVGARGYLALPMRAGDRRVLGLQSGDLMVHPDHRRQGLFRAMNAFGLAAVDREDALFFSFPGAAARQGYVSDGWTEVTNTVYLRPLSWDPGESTSLADVALHAGVSGLSTAVGLLDRVGPPHGDAYEITTATNTPATDRPATDTPATNPPATNPPTTDTPASLLSALYERHRPPGIHARRTEELYEWRLAEPRQDYTTYVARRDGSVVAACLVSEDEDFLQVRDILPYGAEAPAVVALLRHAARAADEADFMRAWRPATLPATVLVAAGLLPETVLPPISASDDLVTLDVPGNQGVPEGTAPGEWDIQLLERDY